MQWWILLSGLIQYYSDGLLNVSTGNRLYKKNPLISLKIVVVLANSEDPDKMPQIAVKIEICK